MRNLRTGHTSPGGSLCAPGLTRIPADTKNNSASPCGATSRRLAAGGIDCRTRKLEIHIAGLACETPGGCALDTHVEMWRITAPGHARGRALERQAAIRPSPACRRAGRVVRTSGIIGRRGTCGHALVADTALQLRQRQGTRHGRAHTKTRDQQIATRGARG